MKSDTEISWYLSRSIHDWLIWIKYISWLYYANEMGLINQWTDVTTIECDATENTACFNNGDEILAHYGFKEV